MMPRISFAHSPDGTNIAYTTLGDGPPLVLMPAIPFSHLEKMWELPELREGLELIARRWTVVRYDNRGCGLSDREAADYSLDAHVADLTAVVDAAGLDRLALNGPMLAGPVAVAFAARHPERVTHLVLQSTAAASSEVATAQAEAILGLLEKDWALFTETAARFILQWGDEALARQAAPVLRECVSQVTALALLRAGMTFDVANLLPQIKTPTLVIHNRQFPLDLATARTLAARIPNARLAAVDRLEEVVPTALEFLAPHRVAGGQAHARPSGREPHQPPQAAPTADPLGLSRREIEVLRLVAAGKSNREIGETLTISTNTVDRHVSHILAKIGAANRAEAAAYAAKQRLLA
jgi:pimeloyl-ACP methyl ester carboxylesterase/DNA-binding CsgD family transcriptional regulator